MVLYRQRQHKIFLVRGFIIFKLGTNSSSIEFGTGLQKSESWYFFILGVVI